MILFYAVPANPLKLNSDVHLVSEMKLLLLLQSLLTPDPLRIPVSRVTRSFY